MKIYLIVLTGQGDTDVRVIDEETWDWVTSSDHGCAASPKSMERAPNEWRDTLVPASQIAKAKADKDGPRDGVRLTSGSWQNDRMLAAYPADGYEYFWSLRDAIKAVQAKGDVVEDTVEGYIY